MTKDPQDGLERRLGLVAFFFIFMTVMIVAITVVLHKAMRLLNKSAQRRPAPQDETPPD